MPAGVNITSSRGRVLAGVLEAVGRALGDEHQRAGPGVEELLVDLEAELAVQDVVDLVLANVDVLWRAPGRTLELLTFAVEDDKGTQVVRHQHPP
jgi:hypothetical protein